MALRILKELVEKGSDFNRARIEWHYFRFLKIYMTNL
jgi:hypothetical protein